VTLSRRKPGTGVTTSYEIVNFGITTHIGGCGKMRERGVPAGYLLSTPRLGPRPLAVRPRSGWGPEGRGVFEGSTRLFTRSRYMEKAPPPLRYGGGKISQLGDVRGGAPETSPRSTGLLIPLGLSGRYQTKSNNIMSDPRPPWGDGYPWAGSSEIATSVIACSQNGFTGSPSSDQISSACHSDCSSGSCPVVLCIQP